jgi:hypothetical protein
VETPELTIEDEQRRSDLVHKLKRDEISFEETEGLRALLKREKILIARKGNCLLFFAVTLLIGYVDEYIESKYPRLSTNQTEVYAISRAVVSSN